MAETTAIVRHEVGLHARPAATFVKLASTFDSDINVSYDGRTANAKSILTVLTLGVHKDSEITITAEGDDADEALAALKQLVDDNFGEG
jgi:phosphocarrier protein